MIGISTYCLIEEPLVEALDRLSTHVGFLEAMDEGLHSVTSPELFGSYSAAFSIHAPFHGLNIASVFEPIRTASVGVITGCFAVAAEIGAPVVLHPGYFAWENERELADRQFRQSLRELNAAARTHLSSRSRFRICVSTEIFPPVQTGRVSPTENAS